jgi:uncharacterized protein YjbJ (UPF0337 family)
MAFFVDHRAVELPRKRRGRRQGGNWRNNRPNVLRVGLAEADRPATPHLGQSFVSAPASSREADRVISNRLTRGFPMNDDQVKGRADQVKGTIKEKTGQMTGNRDLEDEGTADKVSGKVRSGVGDAKEKAKDAIDKI